jgi:cold shock CspA family protein
MSIDSSAPSTPYSGRVKWFNNKYGYGFVTVLKADNSNSAAVVPVNTDVFVHHSEINVSSDQYRYLVQGEYVAFDVVKTTNGNHEYQCAKVKGMYGGQLICETRHEARSQYNKTQSQDSNIEASYHEHCGGEDGANNKYGNRRFENVRSSQDDRPRGGRGGRGSRGGRGRF